MYLDREYRPRRRRRGIFARFWPLFLLIAVAVVLYETRPTWLAPRISMPTPTPTIGIVSFLADAESALSRGDYAAALAAYERIATLDPNNAEPWVIQSRLHMIEQDIPAAYAAAAKAVELSPQNPDALAALARAEDWLEQYETALNHALDALESAPNNVEALAILSEIYSDVGNFDFAQEYIDQALALDSNDVLVLRNQAYLLEKRGKYNEAVAALDRALALDPQRSDLYMEKARIFRVGLNDYQKALEAYRAAVDANQDSSDIGCVGRGAVQRRRSFAGGTCAARGSRHQSRVWARAGSPGHGALCAAQLRGCCH